MATRRTGSSDAPQGFDPQAGFDRAFTAIGKAFGAKSRGPKHRSSSEQAPDDLKGLDYGGGSNPNDSSWQK